MPDFYFDFMKPDVWNGLVLASIFIGLALAVLRLMRDRATYEYHEHLRAHREQTAHRSSGDPQAPKPGATLHHSGGAPDDNHSDEPDT